MIFEILLFPILVALKSSIVLLEERIVEQEVRALHFDYSYKSMMILYFPRRH